MSSHLQLGELQLAIMRVLWDSGGATVQLVHETLAPDRRPTASTIGTMLQKMERKGVVQHRRDGRRYVYRASVEETDVRATMVGDLTRRLFGGDPLALLGHLVREDEIGGSDLDGLRALIEQREREAEGRGDGASEGRES
ncbi:MAG: BlaI/MecI/CopY family transcriptional regulator [bacterium]|nr:BlaI/MecI/CopY family transcriptional regulator [bacterium]